MPTDRIPKVEKPFISKALKTRLGALETLKNAQEALTAVADLIYSRCNWRGANQSAINDAFWKIRQVLYEEAERENIQILMLAGLHSQGAMRAAVKRYAEERTQPDQDGCKKSIIHLFDSSGNPLRRYRAAEEDLFREEIRASLDELERQIREACDKRERLNDNPADE